MADSDDEPAEAKPVDKTGLAKFAEKTKDLLSTQKRKEKKDAKKLAKGKAALPGLADPGNDGWFFSDFFLFNYLFRGLGANQLWLTSEDPQNLIARYGQYAHGDRRSDSKIVLDKSLLPELEKPGNLRIFSRKDLLEDFLRTFRSECQIAAHNNQPVLLLLFGHGDEATYGLSIGGTGPSHAAPRLKIAQIAQCLTGLNLQLTILLTSCFSGGWVLRP